MGDASNKEPYCSFSMVEYGYATNITWNKLGPAAGFQPPPAGPPTTSWSFGAGRPRAT